LPDPEISTLSDLCYGRCRTQLVRVTNKPKRMSRSRRFHRIRLGWTTCHQLATILSLAPLVADNPPLSLHLGGPQHPSDSVSRCVASRTVDFAISPWLHPAGSSGPHSQLPDLVVDVTAYCKTGSITKLSRTFINREWGNTESLDGFGGAVQTMIYQVIHAHLWVFLSFWTRLWLSHCFDLTTTKKHHGSLYA